MIILINLVVEKKVKINSIKEFSLDFMWVCNICKSYNGDILKIVRLCLGCVKNCYVL